MIVEIQTVNVILDSGCFLIVQSIPNNRENILYVFLYVFLYPIFDAGYEAGFRMPKGCITKTQAIFTQIDPIDLNPPRYPSIPKTAKSPETLAVPSFFDGRGDRI